MAHSGNVPYPSSEISWDTRPRIKLFFPSCTIPLDNITSVYLYLRPVPRIISVALGVYYKQLRIYRISAAILKYVGNGKVRLPRKSILGKILDPWILRATSLMASEK